MHRGKGGGHAGRWFRNYGVRRMNVKLVIISIALLLIGCVILAMNFDPPTRTARLQPVGSTQGLSETMTKALAPCDDFEAMPRPKPGDWLAEHVEKGQTFAQFTKSRPNRPDKTRDKVYLQPLGSFPKDPNGFLERLRRYATCFFAMPVKVLPPLSIRESTFRVHDLSAVAFDGPEVISPVIIVGDAMSLVPGPQVTVQQTKRAIQMERPNPVLLDGLVSVKAETHIIYSRPEVKLCRKVLREKHR